ncbi:MAG TPA: serine hydrolase domain-containing protein [Chryseosolibacter sp.]|nr:serine hydrolase domain-containing protein [Chryseosolibacter sp.]
MKIWLFVLSLSFVSLSSRAQSDVREPLPDAIAYIDAWLEAQNAYEHLPGMSVGIVKDQELIWSKGYGFSDVKKKIPATAQTVYGISSITKLFTSIAIMQLYERGQLRLDDSLSTILPDLQIRQQFTDSGPITIRSLLTHSSGLPRESDFPYWTGPDYKFPSREQAHAKLEQQETLYPASTYFQYSNLGMMLLGEVIEKVSDKPYDVYIEENILKPLRLSSTYPTLPEELWGNKLATGYSSLNREGTREVVPRFDAAAMQAAAGYSSNVEDLARFASWQFRLLSNGGKEILKAGTLKDMQRVHWVDPDFALHWGLGFMVFQNNGSTLTGHWGTCPGYRSLLLMDQEKKLGIIVLMNAMENPWKYANQIRNILLKGEKEKKFKPMAVDPAEYVGMYSGQPYNAEKQVLSWYGHLAVIDLPTDNPLEEMLLLQHVSGDVFRRIRRDDALGEEIRFDRDDKTGKVTRMWRHSNYAVKLK